MKRILTLCTIISTVIARPNIPETADGSRYDYDLSGFEKSALNVDTTDDAREDVKHVKGCNEIPVKYSVSDRNRSHMLGSAEMSKNLNDLSTILPTISTTQPPEEESLPPLSLGELCIFCRLPENNKRQ